MDEYDDQYQQDEGGEAEAAPAQPDGAFARVNGGMLQSGKFSNQIVSLVGNITAHDTIRTADGSEVRIASEHLTESESGALIVDPNNTIEIMGQASGPTELTAFVWRELGPDMDLSLYNKMITMQQQDKYAHYFAAAAAAGGQ